MFYNWNLSNGPSAEKCCLFFLPFKNSEYARFLNISGKHSDDYVNFLKEGSNDFINCLFWTVPGILYQTLTKLFLDYHKMKMIVKFHQIPHTTNAHHKLNLQL